MPATYRALNTQRQRKLDAKDAIQAGQCIADLARQWDVSRPRAHEWCRQHLSADEHKALADNGVACRSERKRDFHLGKRLEMIDLCTKNGWSLEQIGLAMGVSYTALWKLLHLHCPDGLGAALEDFREDEAA